VTDKLAWGILGTGRIAGIFAKGMAESTTGRLVAVGSRSQESADKFGDEYNIPKRYGAYEAMLADPEVQAVYIATPHPMHSEWAIKCAEAGKHILCEKPIALDYPQAMAIMEAARQNDVFLMEAFMYRCHPQTAKLRELIRDRAIGDVKIIQATFSFNAGWNPEGRIFNNALGGGGILDVGCYAASMARLVAGEAMGKPFADPTEVKAAGHVGETGVDEYTVAILKFHGDIVAQISTGVRLNQENVVRIFGTEGNIFMPIPWNPGRMGSAGKIVVTKYGQEPEEITIDAYATSLYALEADVVAANIENRQAPEMSWADTLGNIKTLDAWRLGMGQIYDIEKPTADFPTVDGRRLAPRRDNNMKYGQIEGLDKPVSRLALGTPGGNWLPYASVMFDEYFRCGGNCFDTAWVYGSSDATIGQWIKNRGVREQVVVLAKGAHTPLCDPANLTSQLMQTLDRMQTDYVDIYMMHRDNPDIPVGEFIDVLNEHVRAGRMKAFGVSNWTIDRIRAANAYANSKHIRGISAVSNNLSLARMIEAPWAGCVASSDPESRAWFKKTQMPIMSWSSTGRGFFAFGDRDDQSNADLVRCWYSEDNFQRLDRVKELAARKGVSPVVIAMAYVLCQPFPTFALFGAANLEEMHISMAALDVQLTPDELTWLNLGE
jgi:predicted dehydrogenase/aryl-alcohol dehydrogenase-like predicted oxidoreductase